MRILGKEKGEEIGFIEIISVNSSQSQAEVIKKLKDLTPGLKVEESIGGLI